VHIKLCFQRENSVTELILARMAKKWFSSVYVFFKKTPRIEEKDGRRCHVFECAAGRCRGRNSRLVYRFLDKGDANSTSNLLRHAKLCWSTEAVEAATATRDLDAAKTKMRDGTILAEFQRLSKDKVTYRRHTQHTTSEARYVLLIFFHRFGYFMCIVEPKLSVGSLRAKDHS
jgi:hypothetical protein